MRRVGAALALAVIGLSAAPLHAADSVATRLDRLEARVTRLEALAAAQRNQATELVTLVRWSAAFDQGQLSKSYRIAYTLKSHCGKPIKIIDGSLDFYGPNGTRIYSIPLIGEAPLDAAGQANFTGTFYLNPARPAEIELRDLPPNQVSTRLRLRRIVFRDNTVLPLE